jgi:hypothetical protein
MSWRCNGSTTEMGVERNQEEIGKIRQRDSAKGDRKRGGEITTRTS